MNRLEKVGLGLAILEGFIFIILDMRIRKSLKERLKILDVLDEHGDIDKEKMEKYLIEYKEARA